MPIRDDLSSMYWAGLWLGIPALIGVLVLWMLTSSDKPSLLATSLAGSGIILPLLTYLLVRFTRRQRVNRRRQAAVSDGLNRLPVVPVFPNEQALSLPVTLQLKRDWRSSLGVVGFSLCGLLVSSFLTHGSNWFQFLEHDPTDLSGLLGVWLGAIVLGRSSRDRPKIEVTPDMLKISRYTLPWSDAKLFAIRGKGKPGDLARQFELSNGEAVLVWEYLRPNRWWDWYKPPVPLDAYEQQMSRLLEYIAARTSLPLYDVR